MAVTIEQIPSTLTPSDNDIIWVFSSDQTGQDSFEFKVEIFVEGVGQGEEKVYPTDGNNAYINASEIIKPLFDIPNIPIASNVIVNSNSSKECYIKVTEVYGDPQAEEASATSSTINVFKSSMSDEDFIDIYTNKYIVGGAGIKSFLTNFNDSKKYWVDSRKSNYISFFLGSTTTLFLRLRTYDISGTLIDTHYENLGSLNKALYNLNVSKKDYPSLNWTNAHYYTVGLTDSNSGVITSKIESVKFYIHEPCTEDRTVYFLNKLGGVDSWLFTNKKSVNRRFSRNNYSRNLGVLNGSSYEYSKFRGRTLNYINTAEKEIKLLSDWNDPDVQVWLVRELLESPLVWMEDSSDIKKRLYITNSREDEPQERYVELVNLEIDLKDSLMSKSAIY